MKTKTPRTDATLNVLNWNPATLEHAREMERQYDCWLYNAQQLQIQQSGWEPERTRLLAEIKELKQRAAAMPRQYGS